MSSACKDGPDLVAIEILILKPIQAASHLSQQQTSANRLVTQLNGDRHLLKRVSGAPESVFSKYLVQLQGHMGITNGKDLQRSGWTCSHRMEYALKDPNALGNSYLLSLLDNEPPNPKLALGTTSRLPPTTETFTENHQFLSILQDVLKRHAAEDAGVIAQAQAMASSAGSNLGSGGVFFPQQRDKRRRGAHGGGGGVGGDGAGGASAQGGAGSGGVAGWIHVSDSRNPPDFGRIATPDDIFGSLQVDSNGGFIGEYGSYQASGTYRLMSRDGILGLSPFLRGKLVDRLRQLQSSS
ncbi:MAG: hypothetical protein M4579_002693 [Chaenotheca gracillima]|nr:MAG: hypothetical protein M4579_002693 [Chaenotheca gracillima]